MPRTFSPHVTMFHNMDTKEYFFSTSHTQRYRSASPLSKKWVPISFDAPSSERPHHVAPRPGIPDGLVTTKEQYLAVFHRNDKEIPNPDPSFQASWPN